MSSSEQAKYYQKAIDEIAETSPGWVARNLSHINEMHDLLDGDERLVPAGQITYLVTASVRVVSRFDWLVAVLERQPEFSNVSEPMHEERVQFVGSRRTTVTFLHEARQDFVSDTHDQDEVKDYFIREFEGEEYYAGDTNNVVEISEIVKVSEVSRSPRFEWRLSRV